MLVSPDRAFFDLAHLSGLASEPVLPLLLSERTLYLLENLVIADVEARERYATALLPGGYVPLQETDAEYGLYKSVVESAQLEVLEMADLYTWLEQLDKRATVTEGRSIEMWARAEQEDPLVMIFGPVPSNQIWRVSQWTFRITDWPVGSIYFNILRAVGDVSHTLDGPITSFLGGTDCHLRGDWYMAPGDYARCFVYDVTPLQSAGWFKLAYSVLQPPLEE